MRNLIKEMLAYALLIAVSVFLLFIFILIARYGEFGVYEPNKFILVIEIVFCVSMLVLGIDQLHNFIKRLKQSDLSKRRRE